MLSPGKLGTSGDLPSSGGCFHPQECTLGARPEVGISPGGPLGMAQTLLLVGWDDLEGFFQCRHFYDPVTPRPHGRSPPALSHAGPFIHRAGSLPGELARELAIMPTA